MYTPILGLPYPEGPDPATVPQDIKALAEKLDTTVIGGTGAQALLPGDVVVSAAATRAGCLLCNGAAVSRTQYPGLFTAIGVAFGAGDGSTTFNVPDYQGRTIMGAGTGSGLTQRNLGDKVGAEVHSHSVPGLSIPGLSIPDLNLFASVASHAHPLSAAGGAKIAVRNTGGRNQMLTDGVSPGPGYTSNRLLDGMSGTWSSPIYGGQGSTALVGATDGAAPGVNGIAMGVSQNKVTTPGTTGTGNSGAASAMQPSAVANVFIKT
jgi:microcystin-dependent protein